MSAGITLQGVFHKATTTLDGGWAITIHTDIDQGDEIIALTHYQNILLQCAFIPIASIEGSAPHVDGESYI